MTPWLCSRCGAEQFALGPLPDDRLCHACHDAQRTLSRFTEADAGIPERYRRLTRASWAAFFQRPWPAALESWAGVPHWVAIWGATGTGKTGLATVLLAEHLRTGRRGRWISGPELSRRIQRDHSAVEDVIAPLLVTSLLVLDEPLTGANADWYMERLLLITRTRDERGLPTIVTSQLLPELLIHPTATAPPPVLSRWLSGIHIQGELGTPLRASGWPSSRAGRRRSRTAPASSQRTRAARPRSWSAVSRRPASSSVTGWADENAARMDFPPTRG